MKEFVEYVARELVEKPEAVSVTEVESEKGIRLELRVAEGDLGRVIGKEGRVAKAVRTLLRAGTAGREGRSYLLDIVENDSERKNRNSSGSAGESVEA